MIGLGIDAGGSSTRWLLVDGSAQLGRGRLPSLSGPLYTNEARAETHARFEKIASEATALATPLAVVAGVTGLDEGDEAATGLAAVLAHALQLPLERIRVVNDMQIAFRSVFEPEEGILVYGGTGSIASCELLDGSLLRVGGHGYLIDDAGGGYWIGRKALRHVLRAADEAGHLEGPLAKAVCDTLGANDWPAIRAAVYGGGRSLVASLARSVGSAAEAGDAEARAILAQAGSELARLAIVLGDRLERVLPVALSGGISRLGPQLVEAMGGALGEGRELRVVDVEPVEAAAAMAVEAATVRS